MFGPAPQSPIEEPAWSQTPVHRSECVADHPIYLYTSCRGLKGRATVSFAIDDLYANQLKYPSSNDADGDIDAELVARRWLLIPLTRAVHLLVVHVCDPESPVGVFLRQATSPLAKGVVEWYAARAIASLLKH
jgi:hypothetical protein